MSGEGTNWLDPRLLRFLQEAQGAGILWESAERFMRCPDGPLLHPDLRACHRIDADTVLDLAVAPDGRPWLVVVHAMEVSVVPFGGEPIVLSTSLYHDTSPTSTVLCGRTYRFLGFWQMPDGKGHLPVLIGKGSFQSLGLERAYAENHDAIIPADVIVAGNRPLFRAVYAGQIAFASLLPNGEIAYALQQGTHEEPDRFLRAFTCHIEGGVPRQFHPFQMPTNPAGSAFRAGLNGDIWLLEAHSRRAEEPYYLRLLRDASTPIPAGEYATKLLETGIRDITQLGSLRWVVSTHQTGLWDVEKTCVLEGSPSSCPTLGTYRGGFRLLEDDRRSFVAATSRHDKLCIRVENLELPPFDMVTPVWESMSGSARYWGLAVRHSEREQRKTFHLCEMDVP